MGGLRSLSIFTRSLCLPAKKTFWSRRYWAAEIQPRPFIPILLLLLTIATGLQDAVVFLSYRCLHSAQTGNTVLLGLAMFSNTQGYRPALQNAATSLTCFVAGAFLTGQGHNKWGPKQRGWQMWLGAVQTLLVIGAAIVQYVHVIKQTGLWAYVAIGLLASSAGSQISAARAWNVPEITTAMATAAWVDMAKDEKVWHYKNSSRNLRVAFFVALLVGCALGGISVKSIGACSTLVISAALKALVHLLMLIARDEGEGDDLDSEGIPM